MEKTIVANGMNITFEAFKEGWENLPNTQKAGIYIQWQLETDSSEEWYYFDEEFFNIFFGRDIMEACRAWHFGPEKDWDDEYIRLNTYSNLETANASEVAEEAERHLEEIFEMPEIWENIINIYEYEKERGVNRRAGAVCALSAHKCLT